MNGAQNNDYAGCVLITQLRLDEWEFLNICFALWFSEDESAACSVRSSIVKESEQ